MAAPAVSEPASIGPLSFSSAAASAAVGGIGDMPRAAPKTPQAVLAPVRVVGELISRGPSAVLVDAGRRASRDNPPADRFAPLYPVNMGEVQVTS